MILLWFAIGIALIIGIARYNESNKLFWTLLFAYMVGFAGTKMISQVIGGEKQSNEHFAQMPSIQAPAAALSTVSYFVTDVMPKVSNVVTAHKPVGQSVASVASEVEVTLSEVFGGIRDQPQTTPLKPPENITGFVNTS